MKSLFSVAPLLPPPPYTWLITTCAEALQAAHASSAAAIRMPIRFIRPPRNEERPRPLRGRHAPARAILARFCGHRDDNGVTGRPPPPDGARPACGTLRAPLPRPARPP
ncbi:hypothetical protein GCM10007167_25490 [Vulcaniibacterium thermophilum]|uniref:Uncharacterized protein n=1 Tax=Vulcaniibacterium thermophilum TaxID=1169913 RepID=A0A918Z9B4_9GAMM|nr:hypothetical protein GCM10007167_25490 [Vulcaniibacterium thermophilum]